MSRVIYVIGLPSDGMVKGLAIVEKGEGEAEIINSHISADESWWKIDMDWDSDKYVQFTEDNEDEDDSWMLEWIFYDTEENKKRILDLLNKVEARSLRLQKRYENEDLPKLIKENERLDKLSKDLQETITYCEGEVAEVYCAITKHQLSKMNYEASIVIGHYEDYVCEQIDEAIEDYKAVFNDLKGTLKDVLKWFEKYKIQEFGMEDSMKCDEIEDDIQEALELEADEYKGGLFYE